MSNHRNCRQGRKGRTARRIAVAATSLQSNLTIPRNFQPTRKAVNIQYPVFSSNCIDGTVAFLFFGTISSGSISIKKDIINDIIASREYNDMTKGFALMRALGLRLRVIPTSTGSDSRVLDLPSFFITPFLGTQTETATTAVYSDTTVEVMTSGMAHAYEIYYRFPGIIIGLSGCPIGGSQCYINTNSFATNANLNIIFGALTQPQWSGSTGFARVAIIASIMTWSYPLHSLHSEFVRLLNQNSLHSLLKSCSDHLVFLSNFFTSSLLIYIWLCARCLLLTLHGVFIERSCSLFRRLSCHYNKLIVNLPVQNLASSNFCIWKSIKTQPYNKKGFLQGSYQEIASPLLYSFRGLLRETYKSHAGNLLGFFNVF